MGGVSPPKKRGEGTIHKKMAIRAGGAWPCRFCPSSKTYEIRYEFCKKSRRGVGAGIEAKKRVEKKKSKKPALGVLLNSGWEKTVSFKRDIANECRHVGEKGNENRDTVAIEKAMWRFVGKEMFRGGRLKFLRKKRQGKIH